MTSTTQFRVRGGLTLLAGLLAVMAVAPCRAEPFNGVYVGGDLGFERSGDVSDNGWTFGGFAGFNVRLGDHVVIGAEARLADSTLAEAFRRETATDVTTVRNAVGRSIGLSARVGWLAGDRTLLFLRGGWENTRFTSVQTRTPKPPTANPNPVVSDFSFNDDALVIGAGVEHALADNVSLRLTYDWAKDWDRHQVRAGVAFHF